MRMISSSIKHTRFKKKTIVPVLTLRMCASVELKPETVLWPRFALIKRVIPIAMMATDSRFSRIRDSVRRICPPLI